MQAKSSGLRLFYFKWFKETIDTCDYSGRKGGVCDKGNEVVVSLKVTCSSFRDKCSAENSSCIAFSVCEWTSAELLVST